MNTQSNPQESFPPRKSSPRRRWPFFLFGPPLLLCLVLAALIILLRTDFGLQRAEALLGRALENVAGQRIILSGLGGRFPFFLSLEGLSLQDRDGVWLEVDGLVLRWSGRDLFRARLRVQELSAERLELHRPPLIRPSDPKPREPFQGIGLPRTFFRAALDELRVDRLVLAEALAGERIELSLDAGLNMNRAVARAELRLESRTAPEFLLALQAGLSREANVLTLRAGFDDPKGRFASLLGLPKATPLSLQLDGHGPAASWAGTLTAGAGDLAGLHSSLTLDWQDLPKLSWTGDIRVDHALLPEPARHLPTGLRFDLDAALTRPDLLRLERFSLENPMLLAELSADLDLAKAAADGSLSLVVEDTAPLNTLLGVELGPEIRLAGTFSGPLDGPDAQFSLALQEISAAGARISALELLTTVSFTRSHGGRTTSARGTLLARGLDVPGAGLPDPLAAALEANFDLAFVQPENMLELKFLTLHGEGLDIRADADFLLPNRHLSARITLSPAPISGWLVAHGLDWDGDASLRIDARGTVAPMDLHVGLQAGLDDLDGLPDPLSRLAGRIVTLNMNAALTSGTDQDKGLSQIRATDFRLQAKALQVSGAASFLFGTRELDASARLDLPDLSTAAPNPDLGLGGSAVLKAHVRGFLPHGLAVQATLRSEDVSLAGFDPFPLDAALEAIGIPGTPSGRFTFSATPEQTLISGRSDFSLAEKSLEFQNLGLDIPGGTIRGQGRVDLESKGVAARIQGQIEDLGPLAGLAGQEIQGLLSFQADLAGPSDPQAGRQEATLSVQLSDLRAGFGTLDNLAMEARAWDVFAAPGLEADITMHGFRSAEARVDTLTARIAGITRELSLSASALGHVLHPFELSLQGGYGARQPVHEMNVERLEGVWAGQALSLKIPLNVSFAQDTLTVSPLLLALGQATVRGQAEITGQSADLRLGVESLALTPLVPQMRGVLTAGAVLSGPKSALRGDFTLLGNDLAPLALDMEDFPAVNFQADARLDERGLAVEALLNGPQPENSRFLLSGLVPMAVSLEPPGLDLPGDAPLSASLKGFMDLGWLSLLILPETQLLAGDLAVDLEIAGTVDDPSPSGYAELRRGMYQHLLQGVLLNDIKARAELDGRGLRLASLTGTDGAGGKWSGQGQVQMLPQKHFPFSFSLRAENMDVLNSPLASARLSEGGLEISGTSQAQDIRGRFILERVDIFLRDLGGPRVVELPVVEINGPDRTAAPKKSRDAPSPAILDLDVQFPTRFFVHGRGLDSEWGGGLTVTGPADDPSIRGDVSLIRGRLDFLGKRFTLAKGLVQLDGSRPPRPHVRIEALQEGRTITSILRVQGQPPDIDFSLHSDPELPEDEILAQMLFGRSLSSITPFQAAQLVMAARELVGHGQGMDILGQARDILQLDDLDIVANDENGGGMRLRAGRYVHERVYLRLEKDFQADDDQIFADVELTRRITLESKIGSRGGGLGLFWKYDY